MNDETLKEYIARVASLREQRLRTLEADELRRIAREVGLSDADLAEAERASREHLTRGRNLLEHGSLELAVEELEEAVALAPGALEPLSWLARAHLQRWQQTGAEESREAARALAQQCMRIVPEHREAYAVLAAVEQRPARARRRGNRALRRRAWTVAAGLVIGIVVSVVKYGPVGREAAVDVKGAVVHEAGAAASSGATGASTARGDAELPVELAADPRVEGLVLEARRSTLKNFPDRSFYELHAALRNEGSYEYSEVKLQMVYLDAHGETVGGPLTIDALRRHQAIMRPGDVHVFSHLRQVTSQVAQVRLEVATSQRAPTTGSYPEARPIELDWRDRAPRKVTVREREQNYSYHELMKSGYFTATWEVTNETGVPLRLFRLEAELYDARGNKLLDNTTYVTHSGGVVLLPGETRAVSTTTKVGQEFDHYKLAVSDVE